MPFSTILQGVSLENVPIITAIHIAVGHLLLKHFIKSVSVLGVLLQQYPYGFPYGFPYVVGTPSTQTLYTFNTYLFIRNHLLRIFIMF